MEEGKKFKTSIYLTNSLKEEIKALAKKKGLTQNALMLIMLQEQLKIEKDREK